MVAVHLFSHGASAIFALQCIASCLYSLVAANECGRRLETYPNEFRACRDGETLCFFFLPEEPFIVLPKTVNETYLEELQKPFNCSTFDEKGLRGVSFGVLDAVTANQQELCFLAGPVELFKGQRKPKCSFNELVEYLDNSNDPKHPAHRMELGIKGLLIYTPRRIALGLSSDPFVENKLVIIRRRAGSSLLGVGGGLRGAWEATTGPFATNAWSLCMCALLALLAFVAIVALFRPTPFLRSNNNRWKKLSIWVMNYIRCTLGGSVDTASPTERDFEPARITLRTSLIAIIGITLIYYEAALIVGSNQPLLKKPVSGQSNEELCSWVVLNDSALEESWIATVNSGRSRGLIDVEGLRLDSTIRKWATCSSFGECFDKLFDGSPSDQNDFCRNTGATVQYIVAFETVANYQFRKNQKFCNTLEIVQTREPLFTFNGGWMYSRLDNATFKALQPILDIDFGIRSARRNQTISKLLQNEIGDEFQCPASQSQTCKNAPPLKFN